MSAGLVPSGAREGGCIPGLSPSFRGVAGHPCHSLACRASHVQWCSPCVCVSVSKCPPFYQDTRHVGLGPIQLPHFNLMVCEDLLFQSSHLHRYRGLGLQHLLLGRGNAVQPIRGAEGLLCSPYTRGHGSVSYGV